jgi:hypothetical protein
MSTGGRAEASLGRLAGAVVMVVLLVACSSSDPDSELASRVEALEQENAELREQLAERAGGVTVDDDPNSPTSLAPNDDSTTSSPSTHTTTITTASTTTTPPPVRGSRERPIPVGRPVRAGDWVYRVLAFEPNVDPIVTQLDENNDPAGQGQVYARLRLRAVYQGDGAGDPRRLRINLVSPDGTAVGEASICCRPARDALTDQAETFGGGVAEGWIYYSIAAEDAFGGKFLAFDPNGEFPGVPGGIGFFAVN